MSKVTLDKEMFKALASETRLDVLHALDERRKTTTEIAAELKLNKATVHEHIKLLTAVGLIRKMDEGRKWIYHELTWDGRKLLHPDQGTVFNVLLGLSVLASAGAAGILGKAAGWWLEDAAPSAEKSEGGFTAGQEDAAEQTAEAPPSSGSSSSSSSTSSQGSPAASEQGIAEDAFYGDSSEMQADSDGSPFPLVGLALALTAFLLISLAIFLRKRK